MVSPWCRRRAGARSLTEVQVRNPQRGLVRRRVIAIRQDDDGQPVVGKAHDHVAKTGRLTGMPLRAVPAMLAVAPAESVANLRIIGGDGEVAWSHVRVPFRQVVD